ncbi:MAG: glycosyltransferase family 4 protein [Candidatus Saccharimonas sp.]
MRIAMMVRGFLPTPPQNDIAYSPASVAKSLAEGLAARGHDITFFGPEGTTFQQSSIVIETCGLQPTASSMAEFDEQVSTTDLFADYRFELYDGVMARQMFTRADAGEFDCVVFHHFESALTLAPLFPEIPVVFILHDVLDKKRKEVIEQNTSTNQHFISISNNQRRGLPDLNYAATIYNGIDTEKFELNEEAEDYLMISGRITPEKGVSEAVQVAIATKRRLLIAGSLSRQNFRYFDEEIKPYLDDKILYLGMLDHNQLVKYYSKAAVLLCPIQWDEPFGLSMAEANSCGTPVIAFNRGSVPEVVADGKSGFIVNNSAEMILAIEKLNKIKRKDCAKHARDHFSESIMVDAYEKILQDITAVSSKPNARITAQKRHRIYQGLARIGKLITGQDDLKH